MTVRLVGLVGSSAAMGLVALSSPAAAADASERQGIGGSNDWAYVVQDRWSKTLFEREYGAQAEAARRKFPTLRLSDGRVVDGDSWAKAVLDAAGVTPHALDYEPGVGVLYVEMNGVSLTPTCPGGQFANGALNCTPLVSSPVDIPPMSSSATEKAAAFQQLQSYYEPFNIVMSTQRPPDFLPYTMAVIGGSAGLTGNDPSCGIANVACNGLKRNHVSLTFPGCGDPAGVAAQETGHNWGLEHTDNSGDLMMQGVFAVQSFLDTCMNVLNQEDNLTQCGYVHELHCPEGQGEQQNSFAELMGVFGPRQTDSTPPSIVEIHPEDGAVFSTSDSFSVGATVDEDGRMVGLKWSWLEGLPEDTDSFTKCTNQVCDADFNPGPSYEVSQLDWDFVVLQQPPAGQYSFQLEVVDAYGHYVTQTVTVEVVADEDPETTAGGSSGGDDDGSTGTSTTGPGGTTGEDDDDEDDGSSSGTTAAGDDTGGEGCSCRTPVDDGSGLGALLMLLPLLRRRRGRQRDSASVARRSMTMTSAR